jgi:sialic acid synthase SpsE
MVCVSKYPATTASYGEEITADGISDHTIGLELWRKYKPTVYEKHFCLSYLTGPDAGPWALNENTLKELLDSCGEQA